MTIVRTSLSMVESARRVRFEPVGGILATDVQEAIEDIGVGTSATLDNLLGSTPDLFAVRGASVWEQRAIVGSDLPNPSTTTLGGIFSLPVTSNSVLSGVNNDGTPTRATVTGTGDVVRAAAPSVSGDWSLSGTLSITSSSSTAMTVGRQGVVNPAFQVNAVAGSSATGMMVNAQSAASAVVNITAISSGTNCAMTFDGKGSGTIDVGITSTGAFEVWRTTNFLGPGTANFFGATSGFTSLTASAVASGALTLPAATDTLVGKATTDTFTNKTYNTGGTGNVFTLNGAAFGTQAQAMAALSNPLPVISATVDFNAVADYELLIPAHITTFGIQAFRIINTGTTASLTTAQFGVFTQPAGAGVAVIATGTALTAITSNAANTNANQTQPAVTINAWWDRSTLTNGKFYFRVTQAQGAAASGKVFLIIIPYI